MTKVYITHFHKQSASYYSTESSNRKDNKNFSTRLLTVRIENDYMYPVHTNVIANMFYLDKKMFEQYLIEDLKN